MGNIIDKKIAAAENYKIKFDDILKDDKVGIYGFFAINGDEKKCFYVGKSTSFRNRMFSSSCGHIHCYLRYRETNGDEYKDKLIVKEIQAALDKGYSIKVECLETVEYRDEFFSRAQHRLALAELKWIVHFQEKGECLTQLLDGNNSKRDQNYWNKHYKKV